MKLKIEDWKWTQRTLPSVRVAQAAHLVVFLPGRPEAGEPQLRAQRGQLVPGLRQLQHQSASQPSHQPQPGGLCRLQRRLPARR